MSIISPSPLSMELKGLSVCPYLFVRVLELTIRKELEGADGEAAGLSLRRGWSRIKQHSLLRGWVQRVGTSRE